MIDLSTATISDLKGELTRRQLAQIKPADHSATERVVMLAVIACANEFDVSILDIDSRTRVQPVAIARQCSMHLAQLHTTCDRTHLATYFQRDPSNLIHATNRVLANKATDPTFAARLQSLRNSLAEAMRHS